MTYSSINNHRSMVMDDHRNSRYVSAIKQVVTPESVVLDLGAGLGIHGLAAAHAGARKVYLVESELELDIARKLAEENGLSGKIEYIQGKIQEANIKERVDVIVSVFTGNFLLEEDLLPVMFYARENYLKPGGVLIPSQGKMLVAPVASPDIYQRYVLSWSESIQDIQFETVRKYAANDIYYDHHDDLDTRFLADPVELKTFDFMTDTSADCHAAVELSFSNNGVCHGWLGWFEILLGDSWLSTSPDSPRTHWRQAFMPLDPPLKVRKGESISFELKRPESGEWSWTVTTEKSRQQYSTFLSQPFSSSVLMKKSDNNKPLINDKGEIARKVMNEFNGRKSTHEIASAIHESYPDVFPDIKMARDFVIRLVEQFT